MILVCAISNAVAQEKTTGRIIEKLVAEVDKQLTALEDLSDKQSADKETWNKELQQLYDRYDKAENSTTRAAIRSDIVGALAKFNKADQAEVGTTLEAVVKISETMRQLQSAVKSSGSLNPEKLQAQKIQLGRFVKNAARIVRTVEAVGDEKSVGKTGALKNSLAMLYGQLSDPITGAGSSIDRIADTIKTLEDVAVQLNIVTYL